MEPVPATGSTPAGFPDLGPSPHFSGMRSSNQCSAVVNERNTNADDGGLQLGHLSALRQAPETEAIVLDACDQEGSFWIEGHAKVPDGDLLMPGNREQELA